MCFPINKFQRKNYSAQLVKLPEPPKKDYTNSQLKGTTLLNKINITTYFENLTVELYVLYVLNTQVKFCVNRILFTI